LDWIVFTSPGATHSLGPDDGGPLAMRWSITPLMRRFFIGYMEIRKACCALKRLSESQPFQCHRKGRNYARQCSAARGRNTPLGLPLGWQTRSPFVAPEYRGIPVTLFL
jgi:hypothetical protein